MQLIYKSLIFKEINMPLLDSFKVDHTRMNAPAVRVAKTMRTPKGDDITVFDLRFCIPNKEILPPKGIHTLEHLFAGFMRDHLNNDNVEIIDISPMGCRTGFYMSLIGTPNEIWWELMVLNGLVITFLVVIKLIEIILMYAYGTMIPGLQVEVNLTKIGHLTTYWHTL